MRSHTTCAVCAALAAAGTGSVRLRHHGGDNSEPAAAPAASAVRPEDRLLRRADRPPPPTSASTSVNGAELAIEQYNEKQRRLPGQAQAVRLPGRPDAGARRWPRRRSTTRRSSASSARRSPASPRRPTRSSTRPACRRSPPSATNPTLAQNGWKTFHRVLGNDASQGPAAAKYSRTTLKATKVFVDRRRVGVRQGPGRHRQDATSVRRSSAPTRSQQKQTDFSADGHQGQASADADALFFGGYYAEAGLLVKQLRDAGWKGTVRRPVTASRTTASSRPPAPPPRARSCTCPLPAGSDKASEFPSAYKAKFNADPATYSAEGYDAANIFLDGIAAGKTDRADMNDVRQRLRQAGHDQADQVRRQRRAGGDLGLGLQGRGRQVRPVRRSSQHGTAPPQLALRQIRPGAATGRLCFRLARRL